MIVILGALRPDEGRVEALAASRAPDAASPEAEPSDPTEAADFPTVEGRYQMTRDWSIALPGRFRRRVEEENLYLWRPGLTLVIAVWGNPKSQTPAEQLSVIKSDVSPEAYDKLEETQGALTRFAYRLHEPAEDARRDAFYGFSVGGSGYVQLAVYFDEEADTALAREVWRSLVEARGSAREQDNVEARSSAREPDNVEARGSAREQDNMETSGDAGR